MPVEPTANRVPIIPTFEHGISALLIDLLGNLSTRFRFEEWLDDPVGFSGGVPWKREVLEKPHGRNGDVYWRHHILVPETSHPLRRVLAWTL